MTLRFDDFVAAAVRARSRPSTASCSCNASTVVSTNVSTSTPSRSASSCAAISTPGLTHTAHRREGSCAIHQLGTAVAPPSQDRDRFQVVDMSAEPAIDGITEPALHHLFVCELDAQRGLEPGDAARGSEIVERRHGAFAPLSQTTGPHIRRSFTMAQAQWPRPRVRFRADDVRRR
jgi:hypothetical protein